MTEPRGEETVVSRGLTDIALPELRHLVALLASGELGAPFDTFALASSGVPARCCEPVAAALHGLDASTAQALLRVAIAERHYRPPPRLDLVWTGPEAKGTNARG